MMLRTATSLLASGLLLFSVACFPPGDDDDVVRDGSVVGDGGSSDGGTTDGGGVNCGNGIIDLGEDCESSLPLPTDCQGLGFSGGTLRCLGCSFETSSCTVLETCGNGSLDTLEACEGFELRNETCISQGRPGGRLACSDTCTYDLSGCSRCGDGQIGDGEVCDGSNFGSETCSTMVDNGMIGELSCINDCGDIDTEACFFAVPRDEACSPRGELCEPGTTCTVISPFDATQGQCLVPCPESQLGQGGGPCTSPEICLRTTGVEAQPGGASCTSSADCNEAAGFACFGNASGSNICGRVVTACGFSVPLSGNFSSSGAWNNGAQCSLGTGAGHQYCQYVPGNNPADVVCLDAGGSYPVCLGICDGEGGADKSCPSGTTCQVPETMVFVIPDVDTSGNQIPCSTATDCTTAGTSCVQLSSGSVCARAAKMCVN